MAEEDKYIAVESYSRSAGQVTDEYLPSLMHTQGKRKLIEMLDDSTYGGILFVINSIFRSLEWSVMLPKEAVGDPNYEAKREYLEDVLFYDIGTQDDPSSQLTFDDLVSMAITMFPWGYSLVSPVLKKRSDGLVGIGRFIQIAPQTVYEWKIEEPLGRVTGVYQEQPSSFKTELVLASDYLHFKTQPHNGSPEGRSLFRASYKDYTRRERLQTTEAILGERGCGFPVVIADSKFKKDAIAGDAYAKSVVKTLESLPGKVRQNERSGLTLFTDNYKNPDGSDTGNPRIKFQFAPVGQTNTVNYREAIRDYNLSIARSVMAQFMFNGSDSGNRALDKSQTSTFLKSINGFAEIIANVVNRQLVSKMWAMNGWSDDDYVPYVIHNGVDKEDLTALGSYIQSLTNSGAAIFPNEEITKYLLGLAGIPTDSLGTEEGL